MPYGLFGTDEVKTSAEHQILIEINVTYNLSIKIFLLILQYV